MFNRLEHRRKRLSAGGQGHPGRNIVGARCGVQHRHAERRGVGEATVAGEQRGVEMGAGSARDTPNSPKLLVGPLRTVSGVSDHAVARRRVIVVMATSALDRLNAGVGDFCSGPCGRESSRSRGGGSRTALDGKAVPSGWGR